MPPVKPLQFFRRQILSHFSIEVNTRRNFHYSIGFKFRSVHTVLIAVLNSAEYIGAVHYSTVDSAVICSRRYSTLQ